MTPSEVLDRLELELRAIRAEPWSEEANAWVLRAAVAFRRILGEEDPLFVRLGTLDFSPYVRPVGTLFVPSGWSAVFEEARKEALGILDAARFKLELDSSGLESAIESLNPLARLHPDIQKTSGALFRDQHFASAILEAFKAVDNRVKTLTGISDKAGSKLMAQAFREQDPILHLNELKTTSDRDEQEGFKLIFMGSSLGIRNPKAHDLIVQEDPDRTLDYLSLASLLMRRLDDAERFGVQHTH